MISINTLLISVSWVTAKMHCISILVCISHSLPQCQFFRIPLRRRQCDINSLPQSRWSYHLVNFTNYQEVTIRMWFCWLTQYRFVHVIMLSFDKKKYIWCQRKCAQTKNTWDLYMFASRISVSVICLRDFHLHRKE